MPRAVPGVLRRLLAWAAPVVLVPLLALLALAGAGRPLAAQHVHSVPFPNGFVGTRSQSGANNVRTYATLGIARAFFIQNSTSSTLYVAGAQGNDVPGTLRFVCADGATLDVPAVVNWRMTANNSVANSSSNTYLMGILPANASPVTLTCGNSPSVTITNGTLSTSSGTSVGGYVAGNRQAPAVDGDDPGGNAAGVLDALNAYLAAVRASRPPGPVTVAALSTSNPRPSISGTAHLGAGEQLAVTVDGVQYTTGFAWSGTTWSLTPGAPLAVGTYDVSAVITNGTGFTLSDNTLNELVVRAPSAGGTVTLGGSFTPNGRAYDGTTAATGSTSTLSLGGVQPGDSVTLASVTLAFRTAAAGASKAVDVTGFTLGGPDAGLYTTSLPNAPTATATIAPRALTVTGVTAAGKVYDGTTAATLAGTPAYANLAAGESFAVAGTPAAAFGTAAVGANKPVTVTGFQAPNANYTVAQPAGLAAAVTPRPLTIGGSFTAADKPFDGTAAATIATSALTLPDAVGGDAVALTGLAAAFATPAVGAGKLVTLTAASLAGAAAPNYTLSLAGAPTATAAVTAAAPVGGTVTLAGSFTAHDKPYDGTAAATGVTSGLALAGVQPGHQVTIAAVTLAFRSPAAGAGKPVDVAAVTLGGPDAALYTVSLAGAPAAAAAVTPRALTLAGAFSAADKVADGTAAATVTSSALQLAGALPGDAVALGPLAGLTAAFADAAVGAGKTVTLTGAALTGADAPNYALSLAGAPTAAASILAAAPPSAAPPSAPIAVAATPGDRALAVAWSPPAASGCSAVTGYVADVSADAGATWTRTPLVAPGALTNLVNNLGYLVRVAAVNACGTGPFALAAGPVVPVAPTRDGAGQLAPAAPGTVTAATNGVAEPVAVEVVQDTVLQMTGGAAAHAFTLRVRAVDQPGAAIPLDTSRTLLLEHGGRAAADGRGFTPGSVASVFLFAPRGAPVLLGTVPVAADGAFAGSLPVPDTLAAGPYTLQVNGVDRTGAPRAVALGVEVAAPPPELELAATPSDRAPAVGDTITITLVVTNAGRGPAINAVIPRAFTESGFVVLAAAPLDGSYDDRTKSWTIPHLAVGAQARLRFTAVVLPPDAASPNAVPNAAPSAAPAPSASPLPTPRP